MKSQIKPQDGETILFEKGGFEIDPHPYQFPKSVRYTINGLLFAGFLLLIILDEHSPLILSIVLGALFLFFLGWIWLIATRKTWVDHIIVTDQRVILPYKEISFADIEHLENGFDINGVPSTDIVTTDGETTTLPAIEVKKVRQIISENLPA